MMNKIAKVKTFAQVILRPNPLADLPASSLENTYKLAVHGVHVAESAFSLPHHPPVKSIAARHGSAGPRERHTGSAR